MIEQLRAAPSGDELAVMYAEPNDPARWWEHRLRTAVTVTFGRGVLGDVESVIDPAAGRSDAARQFGTDLVTTGDLSWSADVHMPGYDAVDLLEHLAALPSKPYDLVLLGEILEHVENPAALLAAARAAGRRLLLSTPLDEPPGVNPEHVWRWDRAGVEELLGAAGWSPIGFLQFEVPVAGWGRYRCQVHVAERAR